LDRWPKRLKCPQPPLILIQSLSLVVEAFFLNLPLKNAARASSESNPTRSNLLKQVGGGKRE
jgi:hypothetical protein